MKDRTELLEWLKNNNAFANNNYETLTSGIARKIKNRPEVMKDFKTVLNLDSDDPSELIYNVVHPECSRVCEVCGKPVEFVKYYFGYRKTCSKACAAQMTVDGGKETKLEKYGDSHYNNKEKNQQTKIANHGTTSYNNLNKIKQTKLERYSNSNYNNTAKRKQTCLDKYGYDNAFKRPEYQKQVVTQNLDRYGIMWNCQRPSAIVKQSHNKTDRFLKDLFHGNRLPATVLPLFTEEEYHGVSDSQCHVYYKFQCTICNNIFEDHLDGGRVPICKNCNPSEVSPTSEAEKDLVAFIRSIYNGIILENDRRAIAPLELDVYLPEKKVAVEYNGLYWHSNAWKESNYHLEKTKMCEEKGIHLIQIFSDEWEFKRPIVEDIIKASLGLCSTKIGAKKCKVVELSNVDGFLNTYHLDGADAYDRAIGLTYKDELVSVMTIRGNIINRFVTKSDYIVVGGFTRLLSHLNGSFIAYVDRRIFRGDVCKDYPREETEPNFTYTNDCITRVKEGDDSYYRIYDSGNWKFTLA